MAQQAVSPKTSQNGRIATPWPFAAGGSVSSLPPRAGQISYIASISGKPVTTGASQKDERLIGVECLPVAWMPLIKTTQAWNPRRKRWAAADENLGRSQQIPCGSAALERHRVQLSSSEFEEKPHRLKPACMCSFGRVELDIKAIGQGICWNWVCVVLESKGEGRGTRLCSLSCLHIELHTAMTL